MDKNVIIKNYNNIMFILQDSFGPPNNSMENKNAINEPPLVDEKLSKIFTQIINLKIKVHLNSLFSIIHRRIKKTYREIFPFLFSKTNRGYIDYEKSKLNLKRAIILHKIKSSCLNLFEIYKYFRLRKKMKFFQKWKNILNLKKEFEKIEKSINDKYNKLYETKTNNINKEIKIKQKAIDDLKENEKVLYNSNKQMEKEKESLLKNEKKLLQKIEQIEKENAQLEKEKKTKEAINSNTYQNFFPKKENYEEKIQELKKKLKELEDEEMERKTYMEEYSEEMANMMNVFEQKAQEIMRLQNTGHMRRRFEMNTGSYESTNPGSEYNFNETINRNNSKYIF